MTAKPFDLKRARLNAGHSIRSLATEIDVPANTLARVEQGLGIHPASAKKIADHFGVQVVDLLPLKEAA